MSSEYPPMCYFCEHAFEGEGWKCSAFPDGVPRKIVDWTSDHREPIKGDRGIQFRMNPTADPALFEMLFPAK